MINIHTLVSYLVKPVKNNKDSTCEQTTQGITNERKYLSWITYSRNN